MTWRCFVLATVVVAARAASSGAAPPQPVAFDGLGLGDFDGTGSIAAEVRRVAAGRDLPEGSPPGPISVAVRGPDGRSEVPLPLSAEVRSRIERFDIAAGLLADPHLVQRGPARWTGAIGVSHDRSTGRESLEVRTSVGNDAEWGLVGFELGPRIERRFGRGMTFFIDGKAEAQALRPADAGWWALPGAGSDGLSMLGVTARTGVVR